MAAGLGFSSRNKAHGTHANSMHRFGCSGESVILCTPIQAADRAGVSIHPAYPHESVTNAPAGPEVVDDSGNDFASRCCRYTIYRSEDLLGILTQ